MISESCDPADFVRAVVGWDRLRLDAELDREIAAAEFHCDKARLGGTPFPRGASGYIVFLKRVRVWLEAGHVSPQMRRETKSMLLSIGESLAARGQLDEGFLRPLRPPRAKAAAAGPGNR